jgi:hypothetical protein
VGIEVLRAAARLDDRDGVERFLAGVPGPDALRPMLQPGRRHPVEHYEKETRTARFLVVDWTSFVCFVVSGISLEETRAIARQSDQLVEWSTPNFHQAIERALNVTFPPPA